MLDMGARMVALMRSFPEVYVDVAGIASAARFLRLESGLCGALAASLA